MKDKFIHPEQMPDEILLGNFTEEEFNTNIGWVAKRIGGSAYDKSGNIIFDIPFMELDGSLHSVLSPVFVKRVEIMQKLKEVQEEKPNDFVVLLYKAMLGIDLSE